MNSATVNSRNIVNGEIKEWRLINPILGLNTYTGSNFYMENITGIEQMSINDQEQHTHEFYLYWIFMLWPVDNSFIIYVVIIPSQSRFKIIFTLAVSSPNNVNMLIRYNNQLMFGEQHFTNIAAILNMGFL